MKKLFVLMLTLLALMACNGVSETEPYEPMSTRDEVDYDFFYPPAEMIDAPYIEDWMLPQDGILTYAEDMGEYCEFSIGAVNGSQYDAYLQTLEDNGMEKVEEKFFRNDSVEIRVGTVLFNRNPRVNEGLYNASYLDVYIHDRR